MTASIPTIDSDLLTEQEAAALLRLTPSALRSWRARGMEPPFIRVGGRVIRYRRQDLLDWLEASAVHPTPMRAIR